ncbi:hypothetical protein [Nonomuraea guangzhouensis]|uniref:MFS transporter n=1 Tax=Nonomuraea guangzhouensis TaxID=1291555 RepID=A0ABW4GSU9_9ACTN|nr:hypothetical protein [Nonomuraea guangzhouensis]
MAVPPIQRSPNAPSAGPSAGVRLPWLLDSVLGLLIIVALPLAIIAIPNTVSVVSGLLPDGFDKLALMRAHGLALPAMILTVPLAAVALRHVKVAHMLLGGLAVLALADAAGGFAGSTFLVAVLRVLHGVGAGLLIPATLVAAWERPMALRAIWTGMLAVSLLTAQALALWPLDDVDDWRVTLQPYPLLTGIALALAAVYFVVWLLQGQPPMPTPRAGESSRLLLASVPAVGIAVVAISTASEEWGAGLVILLAVLAIVALLVMAYFGSREGRTLAYVMVAVGIVLLPSLAQVTYVEMRGLGGPGLLGGPGTTGLWIPFLVAGLLALAAAVGVRLFAGSRWLVPLGLLAMVVGLSSVRVVVPAADGLVLVIPFTLLAAGAAVALTSALGQVGIGAALFGLALCFPGVLAGYLLATGVQLKMLRGVTVAQQLVDRFVGTLHLWSLIGGFLVVAVIVLAELLTRRAAPVVEASSADGESASSSEDLASSPGAEVAGEGSDAEAESWASGGDGSDRRRRHSGVDAVEVPVQPGAGDEDRPTGAIPRVSVSDPVSDFSGHGAAAARGERASGAGDARKGASRAADGAAGGDAAGMEGAAEDTGPVPPVPPQAQSPEDTTSP